MSPRKIALSIGDPLSIGPEVCAKALHDFVKTNKDVFIKIFSDRAPLVSHWTSRLKSAEKSSQIIFQSEKIKLPKREGRASGRIALEYLRAAALSCVDGDCDALVTGPVDKSLCALSDRSFAGQTEFIQRLAGAKRATMMLASEEMRVALVTTHLPLRKVASSLSIDKICAALTNLIQHLEALRPLKISQNSQRLKIAVCGLNPHASDRGLLGDEEAKIISPALRRMRSLFPLATIEGPCSADSLFIRATEYDAILAMYHDQGLIPLKMRGFESAINVSLGLPFLRTSVDHGTAFDLVGKRKASYTSCLRAFEYAGNWLRYKYRLQHSNSRGKRAQS